MLRRLNALGFQQDEYHPLRPQAALLDKVMQRRRGQPLALALLSLELARGLSIPLEGVNFPGHFLLRVPVPTICSTPVAADACTRPIAASCLAVSSARNWP